MTSTPVMKLTTAVLIMLSDGPATAAEMAGRVNTDQRFAGVLQRLSPVGVKTNQVYAAMSGLRSKSRESKNLIEPVAGRIGEREAYRLTVNGHKAVRDRGLLKSSAGPLAALKPLAAQPGSEGTQPAPRGEPLQEIIGVMAEWPLGTVVRKRSGSQWKGKIVGYYTTELTRTGVAIESSTEVGSVQIYPTKAIERVEA